MTDRPVLEDGDSEINEAFAPCDWCGGLHWWDELLTPDDGITWVCTRCAKRSL